MGSGDKVMPLKVEREFAGRVLSFELGTVARAADSSVLVRYGDTVLLVTVTTKPSQEKRDFLPLLVEYREQTYSAGKIPGGFFKREGKPRDREILIGRAIDRGIRPQFPDGMTDEVEVVAFLLSYDMENPSLVPGILGASLALSASSLPFDGPLGAAMVGRVNGQLVLNPTNAQLEEGDFSLLLVGRPGQISMIEFEGAEIPEEELWEAVQFGLKGVEETYNFQKEILEQISVEKAEPTVLEVPEELQKRVDELYTERLLAALLAPDKKTRYSMMENITEEAKAELAEEFPEMEVEIAEAVRRRAQQLMRDYILKEKRRIDGRGLDEVRPVSCQIGLLPRTHGSALFTRGETQALVVTTLGTEEDVQRLTELDYEEEKRFMLHYNFHPFSVGEVKPLRAPSRREVGHGALAEKALARLIPSEDEFPYVIRVVSDILESNGSTSMATVCGASLSLMDAGVPIKTHVAGISIGLVKEGDQYALLTDIMGIEDHFGDMDFKVAGTEKGVTAIQLDLKLRGLEPEILWEALGKAREARLKILEIMRETIPSPRSELSRYAPKVVAFTIPKEKIGEVIGPGGRTIREIQEKTGTDISISEDGRISIAGETTEQVEEARRIVESIIKDVEVGQVLTGKVVRILPSFGAFVEIAPRKEALLHISEIAWERIPSVDKVLKIGDEVKVKVVSVDELGRIRVSRKALLPKPKPKVKPKKVKDLAAELGLTVSRTIAILKEAGFKNISGTTEVTPEMERAAKERAVSKKGHNPFKKKLGKIKKDKGKKDKD